MEPRNPTELFDQLSPEEQNAVLEFIRFLKSKKEGEPPSSFSGAVDEFIETHGELLRRLAQ